MLAEGKSAIFITHKMDEVMEFSHTVKSSEGAKRINLQHKINQAGTGSCQYDGRRDILFSLDRGPFKPGDVMVEAKDVVVLPSVEASRCSTM
jgi:simple sugar transport system ATP-binding protein